MSSNMADVEKRTKSESSETDYSDSRLLLSRIPKIPINHHRNSSSERKSYEIRFEYLEETLKSCKQNSSAFIMFTWIWFVSLAEECVSAVPTRYMCTHTKSPVTFTQHFFFTLVVAIGNDRTASTATKVSQVKAFFFCCWQIVQKMHVQRVAIASIRLFVSLWSVQFVCNVFSGERAFLS